VQNTSKEDDQIEAAVLQQSNVQELATAFEGALHCQLQKTVSASIKLR
jgi:hypothetical protein